MSKAAKRWVKKPQETHLQYKQRLDRQNDKTEQQTPDRPTAETLQHGGYESASIIHIETNTRAEVVRRKARSAFYRMHTLGQIDNQQYEAACEIAAAMEAISRAVSIRGVSTASRVDNAGSSRDALCEMLHVVRLQQTYSRWRNKLPRHYKTRAMIIDMIAHDSILRARANMHNVPWHKARTALIDALDLWGEVKDKVWREVEQRDVEAIYNTLGEGRLVGADR